MVTVSEAEQIILSHQKDYGTETLPFLAALGRLLAESLVADRDQPPYDRITMDGMGIRYADYQAGVRRFQIAATQAAGAPPLTHWPARAQAALERPCLEVMTGAAASPVIDTVIAYENLHIAGDMAMLSEAPVRPGQNIHLRGHDRRQGEVVVPASRIIGPTEISIAATIGKSELRVKKLPRVAILSSGDELVDVADTPLPYQIRRSNSYVLAAALRAYGIEATLRHVPDHLETIRQEVAHCLGAYDVLLLSGGVSMGKFDYIPQALQDCGVVQHFHKVRQRPGKPFWFGTFGDQGVVFALPGNPVSTFMCLYRYVLPWLETSLGFPPAPLHCALLEKPVRFEPQLQYFMQVKLKQDQSAQLWAEPLEGHGSGDLANLLHTDAFLELPLERSTFAAGEAFPIIQFRGIKI